MQAPGIRYRGSNVCEDKIATGCAIVNGPCSMVPEAQRSQYVLKELLSAN